MINYIRFIQQKDENSYFVKDISRLITKNMLENMQLLQIYHLDNYNIFSTVQ